MMVTRACASYVTPLRRPCQQAPRPPTGGCYCVAIASVAAASCPARPVHQAPPPLAAPELPGRLRPSRAATHPAAPTGSGHGLRPCRPIPGVQARLRILPGIRASKIPGAVQPAAAPPCRAADRVGRRGRARRAGCGSRHPARAHRRGLRRDPGRHRLPGRGQRGPAGAADGLPRPAGRDLAHRADPGRLPRSPRRVGRAWPTGSGCPARRSCGGGSCAPRRSSAAPGRAATGWMAARTARRAALRSAGAPEQEAGPVPVQQPV